MYRAFENEGHLAAGPTPERSVEEIRAEIETALKSVRLANVTPRKRSPRAKRG